MITLYGQNSAIKTEFISCIIYA